MITACVHVLCFTSIWCAVRISGVSLSHYQVRIIPRPSLIINCVPNGIERLQISSRIAFASSVEALTILAFYRLGSNLIHAEVERPIRCKRRSGLVKARCPRFIQQARRGKRRPLPFRFNISWYTGRIPILTYPCIHDTRLCQRIARRSNAIDAKFIRMIVGHRHCVETHPS